MNSLGLSLVDRVKKLRKKLPNEHRWSILPDGARYSEIDSLLDDDEDWCGNDALYLVFDKARGQITDDDVEIGRDYADQLDTMNYAALIRIIDLAERYAAVWSFS